MNRWTLFDTEGGSLAAADVTAPYPPLPDEEPCEGADRGGDT